MRLIYSVEDDADIAKIIRVSLVKAGYEVESFSDIASFWKAFEQRVPDLVLLDLMLPDGSGMDLLRTLRSDRTYRKVKVIILSAKRMPLDKVEGLDCGADDYIEKPFDILELISRVHARFRLENENLYYNDIELDLDRHLCLRNKQDCQLTNTEFDILKLLLENLGKAVPREEIYHKIYGQEEAVESRAIDMHIATLRKKLSDKEGKVIRTVYGIGYIIG